MYECTNERTNNECSYVLTYVLRDVLTIVLTIVLTYVRTYAPYLLLIIGCRVGRTVWGQGEKMKMKMVTR